MVIFKKPTNSVQVQKDTFHKFHIRTSNLRIHKIIALIYIYIKMENAKFEKTKSNSILCHCVSINLFQNCCMSGIYDGTIENIMIDSYFETLTQQGPRDGHQRTVRICSSIRNGTIALLSRLSNNTSQ